VAAAKASAESLAAVAQLKPVTPKKTAHVSVGARYQGRIATFHNTNLRPLMEAISFKLAPRTAPHRPAARR
jgi:hypothetical protein